MTPQNINHLIDAIEATVVSLGITGIIACIAYLISKNLD